jgi:branched-chain amino acid transport system permease protein
VFFYTYLGQLILTFSILAFGAVGLRWTMLAGQFSLAHAAFMGVGAYVSTLATTKWSLGFWLAVVVGALAAGVVAAIVSLMSWRLQGLYLAIGTLACSEAFLILLNETDYVGGTLGLTAPFDATPTIILVGLAILIAATFALERTALVKRMRAIGDDETSAAATGVNVRLVKSSAFFIGGAITGIAGVLFAHQLGSISPADFGFDYTLLLLFSVLIGGATRPIGPVIGAAVVIALPELIRSFDIDRSLIYGPILILLLIVRPEGIVLQRFGPSLLEIVWKRLRKPQNGDGPSDNSGDVATPEVKAQ